MDSKKAAIVVKLYYECGKSPNSVRKILQKQHTDIQPLSRKQIYRLVKKFEEYGTVCDRRPGNSGATSRPGRSAENIGEVNQIIEETPRLSVRKVLNNITNRTSYSTVQRILKFDLELTPYKIPVMQTLKQSDIDSRMEFCNWALANPAVIDATWFSDESHFYLNGSVNKQNMRFWSSSKPDFYEEKPLHSPKVTVWAAISSDGVVGPYFFEVGGETVTITTDTYLSMMNGKFVPELKKRGCNMSKLWFQQDGAAPHTANRALEWMQETFGRKVISLKTAIAWPPHSPDLSPLDFYMWGHLKQRVYTPPPANITELKQAIRREMRKIDIDTCKAVIKNFNERIRRVVQNRGGHVEHVM